MAKIPTIKLIVSPDESWGIQLIALLPLLPCCHCIDFLCALYTPEFSSNLFSNSGHKSLVPRSRRQSILSALWFHLWPLHNWFSSYMWFHLWPLGGQIHLFLVCTVNPSVFNSPFSNSHGIHLTPRPRYKTIFSPLQFHFWLIGGQVCFSCMCPTPLSNQWIFSKFTPNVHLAMV